MKMSDIALDDESMALWAGLQKLNDGLRGHAWTKYHRVNPFVENLFEWKDKGGFIAGKDVTVYDSTTIVGDVSIGDHTWIGPFCSLDGTGRLTVGSYCAISAGTQILTHDTVKWALSGGRSAYEYSPVCIGDRCFLGVHSVVTRGVTVGERCLIAAGAVVTGDVPAGSIMAGVPARRIGSVVAEGDGVRLVYDRT